MKCHPAIRAAVAAVALLLPCASHAQLFRAYLASDGNDANPCTLAQPCRLLQAALAAVASGGQIWILDSANSNTAPVAIAKSVSILAIPGAVGSVVATGGDAITVAAGGVTVVLRNLAIGPFPGTAGASGLTVTAGTVTLEDCVVANLGDIGVNVAGPATVRVIGSAIRGNASAGIVVSLGARATVHRSNVAGNGNFGIQVPAVEAVTTRVDISETLVEGHTHGVVAQAQAVNADLRVSVVDSRIVNNSQYGILAQANSGKALVVARGNLVSGNGNAGIGAVSGGTIHASRNTVTGNAIGLQMFGATFKSAKNNEVYSNGTEIDGTIDALAME
jgi:hypothetical protein